MICVAKTDPEPDCLFGLESGESGDTIPVSWQTAQQPVMCPPIPVSPDSRQAISLSSAKVCTRPTPASTFAPDRKATFNAVFRPCEESTLNVRNQRFLRDA